MAANIRRADAGRQLLRINEQLTPAGAVARARVRVLDYLIFSCTFPGKGQQRTIWMERTTKSTEYKRRFTTAEKTEKWAVTMAKVRIRQAVAQTPWPRWTFVNFCGPHGGESRGVVDMIAVRKDHTTPRRGMKRGDALRIILIQVKGGSAPRPTSEDGKRLRFVARLHGACGILLATWKKGRAARFFSLRPEAGNGTGEWNEVVDLNSIFCR